MPISHYQHTSFHFDFIKVAKIWFKNIYSQCSQGYSHPYYITLHEFKEHLQVIQPQLLTYEMIKELNEIKIQVIIW